MMKAQLPSVPKEEFSEKSLNDLEQLVKSGNHLNYFQSNLIDLNKRIDKMKMDISRLGINLGVKLSQKKTAEINSQLSPTDSIKRHFQDIYEDISSMQNDLDRLFEHV